MKRIINIFVILILTIAFTTAGKSQSSHSPRDSVIYSMAEYLELGLADSASHVAESHKNHPDFVNDREFWYYRGMVYKELYNKYEQGETRSQHREKATTSFQTSLMVQGDVVLLKESHTYKTLKYLATTYNNDAVKLLQAGKKTTISHSIYLYEKYIEIMLQVDTTFNEIEKKATFFNMLGSMYSRMFELEKDIDANEYYELAKKSYHNALTLDPTNRKTHYNLLVLETNYKTRKEQIILWSVIAGLLLVAIFAGLILKNYRKVQKAHGIITYQKEKVERSYQNTKLLSEIGQQITASLSVDDIIHQAYENINKLMDASVLGVLLINEEGNRLESLGLIEKGKKMPFHYYELTETNRPAVLCFKKQIEVLINDNSKDWKKYFPGEKIAPLVSGEMPESLIYLPLSTSNKRIGVITVQSFKKYTYGEYHSDILKNLAIYVAVAVNNAESYKKLKLAFEEVKQTQMQLIQSEKMAALGQLIAGVAHEINTPMGVIRSSVNNIAQILKLVLQVLPEFFKGLSPPEQKFFFDVMELSLQKDNTISTKEERKYRRGITEILENASIGDAVTLADTFVDMGIYEVKPYLTQLQKPNSKDILQVAYKLSGMQRSTESITTAADRASKIVFALKNFVHFDSSGEKTKAQISDGIETVLSLYHNLLKQGVEVIREYSDDTPAILCFPDELNQVWTNIIHNALQAMDNKGTIEIIVANSLLPDSQKACIQVSFTDSGNGIPDKIKDKIFNPFFTTKKAGEGSGLGLDIVKKIIDKHEGVINFESVPGKTTFNIFLPIIIHDEVTDEAAVYS